MKTLLELLLQPDDIKVIPKNSPWYFRWGIQGIRTLLSYRKLEEVLDSDTRDDSPSIRAAYEDYCSHQFSCLYGRRGNSQLRLLVREAIEQGIASDIELRSLVRYGDLRGINEKMIKLNRPLYSAIGACLFITTCAIYFAATVVLIVIAPAGLASKLFALTLFSVIFSGSALPFYTSAIRPYLIVRRIGKQIERCNAELLRLIRPAQLYPHSPKT